MFLSCLWRDHSHQDCFAQNSVVGISFSRVGGWARSALRSRGQDSVQVLAGISSRSQLLSWGNSESWRQTQTREFPSGLGRVVSDFIPVSVTFFHRNSLSSSLLLPAGQKRRLLWRTTLWWSLRLRSGGVWLLFHCFISTSDLMKAKVFSSFVNSCRTCLAHLLMLVAAHGLGQNWVFFVACAIEKHL